MFHEQLRKGINFKYSGHAKGDIELEKVCTSDFLMDLAAVSQERLRLLSQNFRKGWLGCWTKSKDTVIFVVKMT